MLAVLLLINSLRGLRKKKLTLVEKRNPYWEDLYEKLMSLFAFVRLLDCVVAVLLATILSKIVPYRGVLL